MMKKYELLLVLPGTLDEKEAEVRSNEILTLVKEFDEKVEMITMGKMRLAYPIKQIRYGYFYTLIFSVESKELKVLQEKLGLTRDLLRALVSVHNPNFSSSQKLSYTTNEIGVTTMNNEESVSEEEKFEHTEKQTENKVSIQDIDKKLDDILSGNIISGV